MEQNAYSTFRKIDEDYKQSLLERKKEIKDIEQKYEYDNEAEKEKAKQIKTINSEYYKKNGSFLAFVSSKYRAKILREYNLRFAEATQKYEEMKKERIKAKRIELDKVDAAISELHKEYGKEVEKLSVRFSQSSNANSLALLITDRIFSEIDSAISSSQRANRDIFCSYSFVIVSEGIALGTSHLYGYDDLKIVFKQNGWTDLDTLLERAALANALAQVIKTKVIEKYATAINGYTSPAIKEEHTRDYSTKEFPYVTISYHSDKLQEPCSQWLD